MDRDTRPDGYMQDARGALIPKSQIRPIDLLRDYVVKGMIEDAKEQAGALQAFKSEAQDRIQRFVEESAKALKTKPGGKKGNVTLMSFDGQYKVVSAYSDFLVFDERLHIAKELIDRCIKSWSDGADDKLLALVNKAFQVDSEGNVNTKRVLELKTLDIDDREWRKAMEAISQATQVVASKNYVRFYERDDSGQYRQIPLNIAAD